MNLVSKAAACSIFQRFIDCTLNREIIYYAACEMMINGVEYIHTDNHTKSQTQWTPLIIAADMRARRFVHTEDFGSAGFGNSTDIFPIPKLKVSVKKVQSKGLPEISDKMDISDRSVTSENLCSCWLVRTRRLVYFE